MRDMQPTVHHGEGVTPTGGGSPRRTASDWGRLANERGRALALLRVDNEGLKAQVQRLTWALESCVHVIENHLDVGNEDAMVDLLHDLRAHAIIPEEATPSGRIGPS